MLYTINAYSAVCQLYLNKTGREKKKKKIFEEVIAENLPKLGKEIVTQIQEAERTPKIYD